MSKDDLKDQIRIEVEKTLRVALICACIMGVAALVAMVVGVIYG